MSEIWDEVGDLPSAELMKWVSKKIAVMERSMGPAWNCSPWVDLANGDCIPFSLHDDYMRGRISDGGWPTRDS